MNGVDEEWILSRYSDYILSGEDLENLVREAINHG